MPADLIWDPAAEVGAGSETDSCGHGDGQSFGYRETILWGVLNGVPTEGILFFCQIIGTGCIQTEFKCFLMENAGTRC